MENDKIYIDGDFNDSYEARIQRSKNKGKNKTAKDQAPITESSGSVAAPKEETNESDDFYKIHALEYSYGDKKELPNSLQRKIHEEMFYYVSHMHPNQKYISDYYDLSKRATQVALDELASLRQQLAERTDWRKRMDALNEVMEPHGLKIVVYESGEWDLEQTIKRPR